MYNLSDWEKILPSLNLSDKTIKSSYLFFMRSNKPAQQKVTQWVCYDQIWMLWENENSRSGPLFYLLMLTPHGEPVDVHRDGDDDFGVPHRLSRAVVDIAGLDPFPFCPAVLKPDLHLHLAQFERVCDLRALGQREILFTVKLLFQFQQLLACESSPSPAALSRRAAAREGRLLRPAFQLALLWQTAAVVPVRETFILAVHGAVLPVAANCVRWF